MDCFRQKFCRTDDDDATLYVPDLISGVPSGVSGPGYMTPTAMLLASSNGETGERFAHSSGTCPPLSHNALEVRTHNSTLQLDPESHPHPIPPSPAVRNLHQIQQGQLQLITRHKQVIGAPAEVNCTILLGTQQDANGGWSLAVIFG